MGFLQAILGGLFTILGAGSLFFIAYKALTIGSDITEMKELLRQMQRGGIDNPGIAKSYSPPPLDTYDPPVELPVKPEFVMPPPISRRLDAERGIRRDSSDDSRVRL